MFAEAFARYLLVQFAKWFSRTLSTISIHEFEGEEDGLPEGLHDEILLPEILLEEARLGEDDGLAMQEEREFEGGGELLGPLLLLLEELMLSLGLLLLLESMLLGGLLLLRLALSLASLLSWNFLGLKFGFA